MISIPKLFEDPRPICAIWLGEDGYPIPPYTHISCYEERDGSTWFAVYKGSKLVRRINGAHVQVICYDEKEEGDQSQATGERSDGIIHDVL